MTKTKIPWADYVWNPVTGCTPAGEGCIHCYAKPLHNKRHEAYKAGKLQNMPQYAKPFNVVQCLPKRLDQPLSLRKPARIFVDSMSDLFHKDVPQWFVHEVVARIQICPRHDFIVLTKRPETAHDALRGRCAKYGMDLAVVARRNVWLLVSAWDQASAEAAMPLLLDTPAAVRGLSLEPLLGPVDLAAIPGAEKLDWIIAGGETGGYSRSRHCETGWIAGIADWCARHNVPYFWKQWGDHFVGNSDARTALLPWNRREYPRAAM